MFMWAGHAKALDPVPAEVVAETRLGPLAGNVYYGHVCSDPFEKAFI